MWRRQTTLLALPLALAACGTAGPAPVPPDSAPVPSDSPLAYATPSPVRPDCGVWTLAQGRRLPAEAADCFDDALRDGQEVRMRVTAPSLEGDPITNDYVVRGDGRVEVTVDARRDRYGSGRVERMVCSGPVTYAPAPAFTTCSTPTPV
ncbi:DUF4362 domain-containing protein [Micromonospora sp. NPDC007271]|uniref:DUF4362 domain-containing protein n=1 Tax=Micromonospora sp. NPDC007271 TaxID=3154587 RepID=UPI0033D09702